MTTLPATDAATSGVRISAALVDVSAALLVWAALALIAVRTGVMSTASETPVGVVMRQLLPVFGVPACGVALLALALAWRLFSASPGQLLLGCQVVRAGTDRAPGLLRALWRALCLVVTVAPLGVGLLWALRDPRRRTLHDRLAGTEVVVEDEARLDLRRLREQVA